jgi:hypothetical protein
MTPAGRWAVTVAIADTANELLSSVNGATPLQHLARIHRVLIGSGVP